LEEAEIQRAEAIRLSQQEYLKEAEEEAERQLLESRRIAREETLRLAEEEAAAEAKR
jgi:hypothetical protein